METRTGRILGSTLFGIAAAVLLFSAYIALVYHGDVDEGAKWVADTFTFQEWIIGLLIALGALLVLLLIVLAMPVTRGEPTSSKELQVNCPNCSRLYAVADSGERPLYHTCPHCGYTDQTGGNAELVTPPGAEPIPEPTPAPAAAAGASADPWQPQVVEREEGGERKKFLVLKCGNCFTNFEVPYSEDRPLYTTCSNCGRRGVLRTPVSAES